MKLQHIFTALAPLMVAASALGTDSIYKDPQGRFTLNVPTGWTVQSNQNGIQLSRGRAYVALMALNGQAPAQNALQGLLQSVGQQWREFKSLNIESTTFGGHAGVFTMAMGINPNGYKAFLALYASDVDGGYVMIQSGPIEEMRTLDVEMTGIARGFRTNAASGGPLTIKPVQWTKPEPPRGGGATHTSSDGGLSFGVPAGWRAREIQMGGAPVQVLEPANGGEERILVSAGPTTANSIQELTQQTVQFMTQQFMPGARLVSQPSITQSGGAPSAELRYASQTSAGSFVAWQVVGLQGQQFITVIGFAQAAQASSIEQQSRAIFQTVRLQQSQPVAPTGGQPGSQTARMLVGHWTWSHHTSGSGSDYGARSTRELWLYPNGRYQYTTSTYVPNMPSDIDPVKTVTGTYRVQGNTIIARADNGQQLTLTFSFVEGGKGMMLGGELYIRE